MLTDRDRAILDFEVAWWQQRGAKENAIRAQFNMSPIRYTQLLNQLLDRPAALVYSPNVVNLLRRISRRYRQCGAQAPVTSPSWRTTASAGNPTGQSVRSL